MLLEKPITPGEVACIKISNGDEIIAKISDIDTGTVTVTKPFLMVLSQDPRTGQPGVQMAPFFMLGGDQAGKFPINRSHIMCMVLANKDAKAGYTQQTTGLTIPGSGGLIT